ncbi:MAG: hypothetical protein NT027_06045 [Proteobacteria bacterium]|nr:hypothetical protein [Pseudomonadota bacterium]
MALAIDTRLWAFMLSSVAFISGCGRIDDASRLNDDTSKAITIPVALDQDSNGSAFVYASTSQEYQSVTVCSISANGSCLDKSLELKFSHNQGNLKIFKSESQIKTDSSSNWKFTATDKGGFTINQSIILKSVIQSAPGALNWKTVLMASDQGNTGAWISAFDNARKKLKEILLGKGIQDKSLRELSLHPKHQSESVKPTSASNFSAALKSFGNPGANDACLVHMTSHGSPNGFNLGNARLSPSQLDQDLTAACGDRPTVVLISACYSGLYVLDQSNLKKDNRIILTAARSDRTSFGCGTQDQYTYWDTCLIDLLPKATKWKQLAQDIEQCIVRKEGGRTASFPQTFIGAKVTELDLPK